MMQSEVNKTLQDEIAFDACWKRIGIAGDRSCPRLSEAIHCRNCPVFSAAGAHLFQREPPARYLEDWTQRIAQPEATTANEELSALVFRIGGEWLAFDAHTVVEVVEIRPIHRVPQRTDRLFLGLANIRGELQLCVSLRELLGIEETGESRNVQSAPAPATRERLLVVEQEHNRWVFPVDEVEGVHRIEVRAMEDLPHTVQKSAKFYSRKIFSHRDKKVGMLWQERVFQALEKTIR
jgi:chemotaxis-related protein WspD